MTSRITWFAGAAAAAAVLAAVVAAIVVASSILVSCAEDLGWRSEASRGELPTDWSSRMHASVQLAYTAKYRLANGSSVRVVHQPSGSFYPGPTYLPDREHANVAVIAANGRLIFTFDFTYLCDERGGHAVCEKTPRGTRISTDYTTLARFVAEVEPGFWPEQLVSNLAAVAGNDKQKLTRSETTIAGLACKCARITDIVWRPDPAGMPGPREFSLCLNENGVLTSFAASWPDSREVSYELTDLSTAVDPADFNPPAAATAL